MRRVRRVRRWTARLTCGADFHHPCTAIGAVGAEAASSKLAAVSRSRAAVVADAISYITKSGTIGGGARVDAA